MSDETPDTSAAETPAPPLLRVVQGEPSPEELAALLAVVAARAAGAEPAHRPARTAWNDPARLVRGPVSPGPAGWRRSALPS